jgi:DNA-binding transcriptional MocR family regulator
MLMPLALPTESYPDEGTLPALVGEARRQFAEGGVAADDICVVSGALDGVERVLDAHLVAGDAVLVEDPGYPAVFDLLRAMGLVPIPVPLDDRGVQPKALAVALRSGARALVLTPRGQNPTGAALDADRAKAIRELLRRAPDLLVIEDDHQGPVSGVPGQSVISARRRWAVVRSVAKSLGPDLRVAFVTGDEETAARVAGRFAFGPGWVSYILQRAVLELLRSSRVRLQLSHATRAYAERREALLEALGEHRIPATGRSGFNVWIPVPDESIVVAALLQSGWAVAPGARFRIASPPAVRVTTATLLPEESRRFARHLAGVLRASPRPRAA